MAVRDFGIWQGEYPSLRCLFSNKSVGLIVLRLVVIERSPIPTSTCHSPTGIDVRPASSVWPGLFCKSRPKARPFAGKHHLVEPVDASHQQGFRVCARPKYMGILEQHNREIQAPVCPRR